MAYLPNGTIIGDKYEVLTPVDKGGMSVVYLVRDTHLNKNWALKEVRKDGQKDYEVVRQSLIRETDMLKKMSHPYLPRIVDIIDREGVFYVVMDFIEGQTLQKVLEKYGAQSEENVIEWAIQICEVLNYLHNCNPKIIYRDMKPGNIMLKPEGSIVVIDFGIAREFKENNVADTVCLGTIGYAAPEQYGNLGQTDARTDIYGLGATLYHLVTGKSPAEKPYVMVPIRQINPSLSKGLEEIILKCTQPDPEDRYQNAAELIYALENKDKIGADYRTRLKKRLAAFIVPLLISLIGFGVAGYAYNAQLNEKRHNYNMMIAETNNLANESIYKGDYDPKVFDSYIATMDIDPTREEAYIQLLDYCARVNATKTGLDAVCNRIDAGIGEIQNNNTVLLDVAELYFGGNNQDPEFPINYQQASKYFSQINQDEIPQARYFAELSSTLYKSVGDIDWSLVTGTLDNFVEFNDGQILSGEKIKNYQLAASVYIANKREFKEMGVDPYAEAITLLNKSKDGINELLKDLKAGTNLDIQEDDLRMLQRQVIRDIAQDYYTADTIDSPIVDYDKSIDNYTELIGLLENENEIKEIYFKIADVTEQKGNDEKTRKMYEELISRYPNSASAYIKYASYLFEMEDLESAGEQYRKAATCSDVGDDANYERLGIKLKNAGINL